jgi:invasion protein IalB
MKFVRRGILRLSAFATLAMVAANALAQDESAAPPPKPNPEQAGAASAPLPPAPPAQAPTKAVSADPASTTATFGDWVMRCRRLGTNAQVGNFCEVAQILAVQGQNAPVAEIAVGRLDPNSAIRLTIALPPNILISVAPRADLGAKDDEGITLTWRRCTPGRCLADVELNDAAINRWRSQSGPGRLQFTNAGGQALILPFSLLGFSQALDAYAKEGAEGGAASSAK